MKSNTLFGVLCAAILSVGLTACASNDGDPSKGTVDKMTLEKRSDLTQICIPEPTRRIQLRVSDTQIIEAFTKSLQRKNIAAEFYRGSEIPEHCKYTLAYSLKGKSDVILKGKMTVREKGEEGTSPIGQSYYVNTRGDVRRKSMEIGFDGQIDEMIDELFKNY